MIAGKHYIKGIQNRINSVLLDYIPTEECKLGRRVVDAMCYSLMIGGKRIRPALCIGATEAVGGSIESVVPLACAVEMIHTYSLIHDDLPAMDDDTLRRGSLTCHKKFDEATAILAGNALLILAFEILAGLDNTENLPLKNILKIIHKISIAAGFRGMIGGQMQDVNSEGTLLSKKQLKNMHFLKTGMIIRASVICGAIMGCANSYQLEHLRKYSSNLGLAFQVIDDILNVVGDSASLGKSVGTDSICGKNTYPSTIGLDASKKKAHRLICDALDALKIFDDRANPLRAIAHYVLGRNA